MTRETIHIGRYCIAGNVLVENFCKLRFFTQKSLADCLLVSPKDDTPPIFTKKTFANRYMYMYDISKFAQKFSSLKVSLYMVVCLNKQPGDTCMQYGSRIPCLSVGSAPNNLGTCVYGRNKYRRSGNFHVKNNLREKCSCC